MVYLAPDIDVSGEEPADADGTVAGPDVRTSLARMLASDAFRTAPQLSGFLSYIVEATLDGRAREIKGYTIATQAFGRSSDFDPLTDPIVRVEAMRLRKAIQAYYEGEGADDTIVIEVPRGGYVPTIVRRTGATASGASLPERPAASNDGESEPAAGIDIARSPAASPDRRPVAASRRRSARGRARGRGTIPAFVAMVAMIVVAAAWLLRDSWPRATAPNPDKPAPVADTVMASRLPFVDVTAVEVPDALPSWFSAETFADTLVGALARFDEVVVIDLAHAPQSAAAPAPTRQTYRLSLRFATAGERVSISSRLIHAVSGEIIWARDYPGLDRLSADSLDELAAELAAGIGQPQGVVFANLRNRKQRPTGFACLVAAHDFLRSPTASVHDNVRACLEATLVADPGFAAAHAALSLVYLEEHRSSFQIPPVELLDKALTSARMAATLAPRSARARQALMAVQFALGNTAEALRTGRHALALNPADPDVMAELGARHVAVGRYDEGLALLERAAVLNPVRPPWHDFHMFVAASMLGDGARARRHASAMPADAEPLGVIARAIVAQQMGDVLRAMALLRRLVRIVPEAVADPAVLFRGWALAPEILQRLADDLQGAGLGWVPP